MQAMFAILILVQCTVTVDASEYELIPYSIPFQVAHNDGRWATLSNAQVAEEYRTEVLPYVVAQYGADPIAQVEEWRNWIDYMQRTRWITDAQVAPLWQCSGQ